MLYYIKLSSFNIWMVQTSVIFQYWKTKFWNCGIQHGCLLEGTCFTPHILDRNFIQMHRLFLCFLLATSLPLPFCWYSFETPYVEGCINYTEKTERLMKWYKIFSIDVRYFQEITVFFWQFLKDCTYNMCKMYNPTFSWNENV